METKYQASPGGSLFNARLAHCAYMLRVVDKSRRFRGTDIAATTRRVNDTQRVIDSRFYLPHFQIADSRGLPIIIGDRAVYSPREHENGS